LREKNVVTIRRVINSDNKGSKWFVNGKLSKQAEAKAIVTELSIDVDNLCSFMPQDKVGSFSRFTPRDLLSNTLLAIENPNDESSMLAKEQKELSEFQDSREERRRIRDAKRSTLDKHKVDLEGMQTEMERMQRREEKVKLLKDYETRLLVVELQELGAQKAEKQRVVDEVTERLQVEQRKLEPLESRERDLKKRQAVRVQEADNAVVRHRKLEEALRNKRLLVDELDATVDSSAMDILTVAKSRRQKEEQLQELNRNRATKEAELAKAQSVMPQLQAKYEECNGNIRSITAAKREVDEKCGLFEKRIRELRQEITQTQSEVARLQDPAQMFRAKLSKIHDSGHAAQVLKAMDWLDNNQTELRRQGKLRGEVMGPVARYVEVADPACAAMLERVIPVSKMLGFVVTCEEDARFMKKVRDDLNLKFVDIYTINDVSVNKPRPFPDALIQQLGLKGYLAEQVQCPDAIRALFYSFHGLHTVLWGNGTNLSLDQQTALFNVAPFRVYLQDRSGRQQALQVCEFSGKKSRYSDAKSVSSVGINEFTKYLMSAGSGQEDFADRKAALDATIREAGQKLDQAEGALDEQRQEQAHIGNQLDALSRENNDRKRYMSLPVKLNTDLAQINRGIQEAQKRLSGSAEQERLSKEKAYKAAIHDFLKTIGETVKLADMLATHNVDLGVAACLRDQLSSAIEEVAQGIRTLNAGMADLRRELAAADRLRNECNGRFQQKEAEFNAMLKDLKMGASRFVKELEPQLLARCPEATVQAICGRMDELNVEINRIADNPLLQQRYDETKEIVDRLEQEVKVAENELENAEESLHERSARWLRHINILADKLNSKFGTFMSDLQLGGEVKLIKTGKFTDYELQLMVRFRENASLEQLDPFKHSGGERAISTAMFLMALQDMTSSPFRVVDEINQGMDESNERLVFDRVVKSCCDGNNKPQYFLVTPKLLQGLCSMDNDDVTILLLWNGPGTGKKWTFSDILRNLSDGERITTTAAAALVGPEDFIGNEGRSSTGSSSGAAAKQGSKRSSSSSSGAAAAAAAASSRGRGRGSARVVCSDEEEDDEEDLQDAEEDEEEDVVRTKATKKQKYG
jgi:structural maintenance of chromosomes protein 5